MFKKLLQILKEKIFFNLMLSFLLKERYKMKKAAKDYSKKNPNGTIKAIKLFERNDPVQIYYSNVQPY